MHRLALLSLLVGACATTGDDDGVVAQDVINPGSPEEAGVVAFVNTADTKLLDITVGLDTRAATNIATRRAGADGVLGTPDDRAYTSIAEIDAVAYVGTAALDKLLVYVRSIGGIPQVVEGVMITQSEAAAIVTAANGATSQELDVDAGLDTRAVTALVAARPLADLAAVARVAYVGKVALTKLRTWAPGWHSPCVASITPRADANVDAWNTLLDAANHGDYPYASVSAYQVPACIDLAHTSPAQAALVSLVVSTPLIGWDIGPAAPHTGTFQSGSGQWITTMAASKDAMESTAGVLWNPAATPEIAALWAARATAYDGLTQVPIIDSVLENAAFERFDAMNLKTDAEECSERATILVERHTGRTWIIHVFPQC